MSPRCSSAWRTFAVLALMAWVGAVATAIATAEEVKVTPAHAGAHPGPYHKPEKVIILYVIPGTTTRTTDVQEAAKEPGDTAFISGRQLSLTDAPPAGSGAQDQVGTLWQTGIYLENNPQTQGFPGLLNYQITIELEATEQFPAGKLFAVGDGTNLRDSTQTLPKTIVGGTGPYADARGILNRPPGQPYEITLFNFYH